MKIQKLLSIMLLAFGIYQPQQCSSPSQELTCWVEPTRIVCSMAAIMGVELMKNAMATDVCSTAATAAFENSAFAVTTAQPSQSCMNPIQKFTAWYRGLLGTRPLELVPQDLTFCYDDRVEDPADIFRVGDVGFANHTIPKGMTREQVYKIMLTKQDKYLKAEILRQLDVTPEEFEGHAKLVSDQTQKFFEIIKRKQIKEEKCPVTPIEPLLLQHVAKAFGPEEAQTFSHVSIAHCDTDLSSDTANADALQDHVTFYHQNMRHHYGKDVALYPVRQQQILFHELSHIRHQDVTVGITYYLLMSAIEKRGRDGHISLQDGEPAAVIYYNGLKKETVTRARLVKAKKLYDQWKEFHEYRADLESAFALKETEEFKKVHTQDVLYDEGYPARHSYAAGYQNTAAVNFLEDFHRGVVLDNACSKSKLPEVKTPSWSDSCSIQ